MMDMSQLLLFLILGLIAGGLFGWFFAKSRFNKSMPFTLEDFVSLKNDKTVSDQRLQDIRAEIEERKKESRNSHEQITALKVEASGLSVHNKGLLERLDKQKEELDDLHKKIKEQFENIAHKIVFDKIIITCGASAIPTEILNQLKPGGIMVAPIGPLSEQTMTIVLKKDNDHHEIIELDKFRFVPMLENKAK